jgi:hypothetical protein
MSISVYYNGSVLNPTPTVSQEYKFLDSNGTRVGNILEITLNGVVSGITSTGNVSQITNIFAPQFKTLSIYENPSSLIYNWQNVIIDEISFPNSHFYSGVAVPYSIKAHVYNVPSGVSEPSNSYSFTHNEDGTVNVNHKISAHGVRTNISAIQNAINFVKLFTGKQPFNNCASVFIPNGSGILLSMEEKIDRANGTYSVTENYKYNTGVIVPYTKLSNMSVSDVIDQTYQTIDYEVKFQGSPVQNDLNALGTAVLNWNELTDITSYGIDVSLLVQTSSEIVRDSGDATIDFKISYLSGYSLQDVNGFFDYNVTLKQDLLLPKEDWKIDGEFLCRGPLSFKQQQLNAFKSTYASDWRGYLVGLIMTSPIWSGFHTIGNLLSSNPVLDIQENTGLAIFSLSLYINDGGEPNGVNNPKYSVDIQPSKWAFELMPAANIEGHYIVQDLQMKTQSKIDLSISAESPDASNQLAEVSGLLQQLTAVYVKSGFQIGLQSQTGINDLSMSSKWIGSDTMSVGIINTKVVGSNNFNWNRQSGYYFGY